MDSAEAAAIVAAAAAGEFDLYSCIKTYTYTRLYRFVAAVVISIVMIKNIEWELAKGSIQYPKL